MEDSKQLQGHLESGEIARTPNPDPDNTATMASGVAKLIPSDPEKTVCANPFHTNYGQSNG